VSTSYSVNFTDGNILLTECTHTIRFTYSRQLANMDTLYYIHCVADSHCLQSSLSSQLVIWHTQISTVGDRPFPVAVSRLWNSLPPDITSASLLEMFLKIASKLTFS